MTSFKNTKRALLSSVVALFICFTMLLGATFAWFTDSVTSNSNVIQTGTLNIEMYWAEGDTDSATVAWTDASTGAIFNNDKWEPGYAEAKHIKIANEGTLALKYKLSIVPNGTVSALANVIDVYFVEGATQVTREMLANATPVGTLAEMIADTDGAAYGYLLAQEEKTATIVFKMRETAGNEYQGMSIGSNFAIQLLATQYTSEEDSLDNQYDKGAAYPVYITAANIDTVDFTQDNQTFTLSGAFNDVTIDEFGENCVLDFENASFNNLTLNDNVTIKGEATAVALKGNGDEPIAINVIDANLVVSGALNVGYTEGKAILNIKNSVVKASTIFVGGHTNNYPNAVAELNITDSYVSCEENSLGSTISVWGQSGVNAKIINSEIYTYSRGWHQSEDANDNSITFQGSGKINVEIVNSNMHLYGARSIVNARKYGSGEAEINFTVDDSFIWVVTKSNHAEETIPVWNATEINDSVLIFAKNVHQSTPAVVKTFVYGNPVITGNYAVTTQCSWDTEIVLQNQTVTLGENANVSVYEGAGNVSFVLSEGATFVIEKGAALSRIAVKAADGYTLNEVTSGGVTTYTVTAKP